MKKYILYGFLALLSLFLIGCGGGDKNEYTDFTYTLDSDNQTYTITAYEGTEGDIVIPDTYKGLPVTKIAKLTFSWNDYLTSVTFNKYLEDIGQSSFSGCTNLVKYVVPKSNEHFCSVDGILYSKDKTILYYYPTYLENDNYETLSTTKEINEFAFYNCVGLTGVTLNDGIEKIGQFAFYNCGLLKEINFPDSLKTIDDNSFYYNKALKKIEFGDNSLLSYIGKNAFNGCKFTEINLPIRTMVIGETAFSYNTNLKKITIPQATTTIKDNAFLGCTSLETIIVNSANTKYSTEKSVLYNKDKTELLFYAPARQNNAEVFEVKTTVTKIHQNAFFMAPIKTVALPQGLKEIGDNAFAFSTIEGIIIPSSVEILGISLFNSCEELTNVTLNCPMTNLPAEFFFGCKSLSTIDLPHSINKIEAHAFDGCKALKSILLPSNLKEIGDYAFQETALEEIIMPSTLRLMGSYIFKECDELSHVEFNDNLVTIGGYNFYACKGLTTITIPKSVLSIGQGNFYQASSLLSINVDEENVNFKSLDGILMNKNMDKIICYPAELSTDGTYVLPITVKNIEPYAFTSTKFKTIILYEGLESIDEYAFAEMTNLEGVLLPKSVKTIYTYAFKDCDKLSNIYFTGTVEEINKIELWTGNEVISAFNIYLYSETLPEELVEHFFYLEDNKIILWSDAEL